MPYMGFPTTHVLTNDELVSAQAYLGRTYVPPIFLLLMDYSQTLSPNPVLSIYLAFVQK